MSTLKVDTFNGPVRYEFVNDGDGDSSPSPPPPVPVKPKKIKKKRKKDKPKKLKKKSSRIGWVDYLVICISIAIAFYVVASSSSASSAVEIALPIKPKIDTFPLHGPTAANVNTTTTTTNLTVHPKVVTSLCHHAQYGKTSLMCMHHLNNMTLLLLPICCLYNAPVKQHYVMINPQLIGYSRNATLMREERSISCPVGVITTRRRYAKVSVAWDDQDMFSIFSGEQSMLLQMAMDEFKGNKHCY